MVGSVCYYAESDASYSGAKNSSTNKYEMKITAKKVSTSQTIGEYEMLTSIDPEAYPESGIVDGYEYVYLGMPFTNALYAKATDDIINALLGVN